MASARPALASTRTSPWPSSTSSAPIFATKFDGSGSDNTDEFRRTLTGHIELQPVAASFYKALAPLSSSDLESHLRAIRLNGWPGALASTRAGAGGHGLQVLAVFTTGEDCHLQLLMLLTLAGARGAKCLS